MRPRRVDPHAPQHRPAPGPRGPYVAPMLPDPGVEIGPWRILPRADGKWILYDERRPLGARTVAAEESLELATVLAKVQLQTAMQIAAARRAA